MAQRTTVFRTQCQPNNTTGQPWHVDWASARLGSAVTQLAVAVAPPTLDTTVRGDQTAVITTAGNRWDTADGGAPGGHGRGIDQDWHAMNAGCALAKLARPVAAPAEGFARLIQRTAKFSANG